MVKMVIFFLVLVSSAMGVLSRPAQAICLNNNTFISQLASADVGLLNQPLRTNSTCSFEFSQFGTCCSEKALVRFAKSKTDSLMADVAFMNAEYKKFQGVLSRAYSLLKRTAMAPLHRDNGRWNTYIKGARKRLGDRKFTRYFHHHIDSAENGDYFARENSKCWEMQAKARQVTLCYTCSGRSSHFFKNNKALISQETCDAFVKNCGYSLAALVKFIRSFELLPIISDRLNQLKVSLNFQEKLSFKNLVRYFSTFKREKIGKIIETARSLHLPEAKAQMCSKFLRLGEVPIISQMRTIFKSGAKWRFFTHDIDSYFDKVKNQINSNMAIYHGHLRSKIRAIQGRDSHRSDWMLARLLQFTGKTEELLNSDSKILDVNDPSYSSVGVSENAPMEFNHQFP